MTTTAATLADRIRRLAARPIAPALAVLLTALAAVAAPRCNAAPFVPTDDGQILERLPAAPFAGRARQLRSLHEQLSGERTNLTLATRAAWAHIEQGRRLADQRAYGYAQATLAPWWDMPSPPAPVLVLRATIRQHNHEFDSALADLDEVLESDDQNAQAWLTRALIRQVRGELAAARADCMQVLQLATPLVGVTCLSGVGSLSGRARPSEDMLRRALARPDAGDSGARLWALTVLGESAARRGDAAAAETAFQRALVLGSDDVYLLAAYADFLLDRDRPAQVVELLAASTRADALLLRLALAEQALGAPQRGAHIEELRDRFAASQGRGEAAHGREAARFTLHLRREPAAALALARRNWDVQREPADARILLECAVATGDRAAAKPVLKFLQRSHLEDVQLARLSGQLRSGRL